MRCDSVRHHLQPYKIRARRTTTVNHAFASATAPYDDYSDPSVKARLREALIFLGQNPDGELYCAYCGSPAETWDHVFPTVKASRFSGYGHRVGNLLPCCKSCNSRKGNKPWDIYLKEVAKTDVLPAGQSERIAAYLRTFSIKETLPHQHDLRKRLDQIRDRVLALFDEADIVASDIRKAESTIGHFDLPEPF